MSAYNALPAYCSQTAQVASRTRILNITGSDADYPDSAAGKLCIAPLAAEFARHGLSETLYACDRESFPSGNWSEPAGFAVRSTLSPLSHEPLNEDGGINNEQSPRIHHYRRSASPTKRT